LTTIQDVADRASVSIATVSHVLNNTRFVSEVTRTAVIEAIRDLNYHPSAAARSLSSRKTRALGMVISDITNIFFGRMIQGVLDVITPEGYNLVLCTTRESTAKEEEHFELLFGRAVDGLIAAATSRRWSTLQLAEAGQIPMVFVDRMFEGMEGPFVGVDNERGAYEAVSHLLKDGHERIGIVAGLLGMPSMDERVAGYKRALQEHHAPLDEALIAFGDLSVKGGKQSTLELLSNPAPPTALFINNNQLTLGALQAIQQLGWKCPEDVALACFDDHPWAGVACPPLTTVRQPDYEIGHTAARILMKMIGGEPLAQDRVILKPELIVRQSCGVEPRGRVTESSLGSP
jgi:LacI family transcriptional regulator